MRASERALALNDSKALEGADPTLKAQALAMAYGLALAAVPSDERHEVDRAARAAGRKIAKLFSLDDPDEDQADEAGQGEIARAADDQAEIVRQVEPAGRRRAREAQNIPVAA